VPDESSYMLYHLCDMFTKYFLFIQNKNMKYRGLFSNAPTPCTKLCVRTWMFWEGIHFILVLVLKKHLYLNTVLQQWNTAEGFNITDQWCYLLILCVHKNSLSGLKGLMWMWKYGMVWHVIVCTVKVCYLILFDGLYMLSDEYVQSEVQLFKNRVIRKILHT
jgi:hypothetical protein